MLKKNALRTDIHRMCFFPYEILTVMLRANKTDPNYKWNGFPQVLRNQSLFVTKLLKSIAAIASKTEAI